MHRYYFDWHDGTRVMRDEDGLELLDRDAARREAAQGLVDLTKDALPSTEKRELGITVRDESGQQIFTTSIVFEVKEK
jgi:hypothetical protein